MSLDSSEPTAEARALDAAEPVSRPEALAERDAAPRAGVAVSLSGGGYRAMLFHLGFLWRLNDAGELPGLARVSSVSGGSITAGVLALGWGDLRFGGDGVADNFDAVVAAPLRRMADQHVDITAVLAGLGLPFRSISDRVVKAYSENLYGDRTLQDLPDEPRFVFNATNLESGVLMRFSKPYLADYRVGRVLDPDLPVAVAVAASSAFPPFLSPCKVDLSTAEWVTDKGNDLATPEYRDRISLSDGGVYDNLGIETTWKVYDTILVSDAGGHLDDDPTPPSDWARHLLRVLGVIDNQVRALRKRQVVDAFRRRERHGMYVGIRSERADFSVADPLPFSSEVTARLASISTRLDALDARDQELLVNWGYAACDAGLRSYYRRGAARPPGLPYPGAVLE